ncbi:MAG: WbqC family protein [Pseudomonadota bacterium]
MRNEKSRTIWEIWGTKKDRTLKSKAFIKTKLSGKTASTGKPEEEKGYMIVACHQPNFLPWIGFFYKALLADVLVLLDDVQFPRGFNWVNRNRLKGDQGELWFTVPLWKKGRGLQKINEVEIYDERGWSHKHFHSILQNYAHAPYLADHTDFLKETYQRTWTKLIEFNLATISYLKSVLGIKKEFILQSALSVQGKGSDLLVNVCRKMGAEIYLASMVSKKYFHEEVFEKNGVRIEYYKFYSPIYPQLWGEFIYNLSFLDLLLNCGEKSIDLIQGELGKVTKPGTRQGDQIGF